MKLTREIHIRADRASISNHQNMILVVYAGSKRTLALLRTGRQIYCFVGKDVKKFKTCVLRTACMRLNWRTYLERSPGLKRFNMTYDGRIMHEVNINTYIHVYKCVPMIFRRKFFLQVELFEKRFPLQTYSISMACRHFCMFFYLIWKTVLS